MATITKRHVTHRRQHEKVKSGCRTCKVRRVKCDEHRPSCLRCIKFGVVCDGYAPPKNQRPLRVQRPNILPKVGSRILTDHPIAAPSSSRFKTEDDARYFETFSSVTAYEIFPNIEMGKLRLMFLQTCEVEDFVRHAIISLGALTITSQAARSSNEPYAVDRNHHHSANHHYQYAVKEYTQVLKSAQSNRGQDLRTALITSLVILAFEGWVGNHDAVVQQIRIGARLLREWNEQQMSRATSGLLTPPSSGDENLLSHIFTRLSVQMRASLSERPPAQQQQQQLQQQKTVPSELPPLKIDMPDGLSRMPTTFDSLAEAGTYYNALVRFAVKFVAQCLPRLSRSTSLTGAYSPTTKPDSQSTVPQEVQKVQYLLAGSLHRWMSAFTPFARRFQFKSLDERKAALTLELQMKATFLGTIKSLAQDEMVFDSYHSIYRDIVRLCEDLLLLSAATSPPTTTPPTHNPNASNINIDTTPHLALPLPPHQRTPSFSFDSSVIIPLWFTGHKCRDPHLRRKVIQLLLTFPRREGVWDSIFAGKVIQCLRDFEEDFLVAVVDDDDEDVAADNHDGSRREPRRKRMTVPAWARIRSTSLQVDLHRRTVEVRCLQRRSEHSEEVILRSRTVDYYVNTGVSLRYIQATVVP